VVRVATSMAPVMAEVRTQRNRQALIGLLTILAAGAVMTVAMSRIVIRPINELAIAARRVGQGDFDARACVDSRDELGQLGAAFNEMTERLAQAYRDLEGKNSELASALQEVHESRQRLALLEPLNGEYGGVFPAIQLHMGINSGEALVGATKLGGAGSERWTFTASGPTTNIAARLAGSATGGEIIVGPSTADRIRQHFVLEALGERAFKNVSQPLTVFRVIPPGVYEKIA